MEQMIYEVIRGTKDCFPFYVPLARYIGTKETIFLSFLIWKQWQPTDWVELLRDEIQMGTGLSHEEQLTIRKRLKKEGLLEERQERLQHKTFYRPNVGKLETLLPARGEAALTADSAPPAPAPTNKGITSLPTKTPAGADGPGEGQHKAFIDLWHKGYQEAFAVAYVMQGGSDGKAAKELLARTKLDAAALIGVAAAAWRKRGKDFWACENKSHTIREFASNWNKIVAELQRTNRNDIPQAGPMRTLGKQPPAGRKPLSQRPPAKYDEDMKKITTEEWRERYPLSLYYDDQTLEPL